MSEKLSNSAENSELNQSTTPSEILDFEARLAQQQEDLAQAQSAVEDLNFKSDAMDRVKAQTDLREAKAAYDENMAHLNDEWINHGGERLENARLAVEDLDFNSDAMDRVKAKAELRDAENAWAESYSASENTSEQPQDAATDGDRIDKIASSGIDKVNQMADEHMQAIEDQAEQASAEMREDAEATTEAPEVETHDQTEADNIESAFDLDAELEKSKQKLHNRADELKAAAQKRFAENNEVADETESTKDDVDEILAAKQALDYQERPDETPASSESADSEPAVETEPTPEDSELTDNESTAEIAPEDGEFVDDEPETDDENDTSEAESEADGGEFVDDDEEESEEDKKRFGKIRSFISSMRKKAGITSVKAYNSVMDGFGSIGGKLTAQNEGELDEAYEKRKKNSWFANSNGGSFSASCG